MDKVYVEVVARFTSDGKLLPVAFIWENGQRYEIERIIKCVKRSGIRAGGDILRYTCIVSGRECHLFYGDNFKWFMERKAA